MASAGAGCGKSGSGSGFFAAGTRPESQRSLQVRSCHCLTRLQVPSDPKSGPRNRRIEPPQLLFVTAGYWAASSRYESEV
jgi:hypothetical protein